MRWLSCRFARVCFIVIACAVWSGARAEQLQAAPAARPRLVDLGSKECIPCKAMAPILEELKREYAGRFDVEFVDVWLKENVPLAEKHGIKSIPTQIFFDAAGKELWRHEGFFSKENILAKWRELKVDIGPTPGVFERLAPAKVDDRPKDTVCHMCDKDIHPRTRVLVRTDKGEVKLCSPHCYFIMYSCLLEDRTGFEKRVTVTDWATHNAVPLTEAVYLHGLDEKTGRPIVKAFASKETAVAERQAAGGSIVNWQVLQQKELADRCGFCDRAVYPEDVALVKVGGVHTWGCCSHCAMGVAARTGKDIEVYQADGLTGEMVVVKTLGSSIASMQPAEAVAWFGQRQTADGKWVSAGCFHQGFFVNEDNLKKWVELRPYETGRQISIDRALADKMKLTPLQIQKACKLGECAPK